MYYEIYKSSSGWRWRLRARNHKILASGEGYKRLVDCEHVIKLIKESFYTTVRYRDMEGKKKWKN